MADEVTDGGGTSDAARELAELAKAGANFALPNTRDAKGEHAWQIIWTGLAGQSLDLEPLIVYSPPETEQRNVTEGESEVIASGHYRLGYKKR